MNVTLTVDQRFITFTVLTCWSAVACWLAYQIGRQSVNEPDTAVGRMPGKRVWQVYVLSMLFFYLLLSGVFRVLGV